MQKDTYTTSQLEAKDIWRRVTNPHANINNKRCQQKKIASVLLLILLRARLRDVSDCVVDENRLHVAKADHYETWDGIEKHAAQEKFEHNPKEQISCIRICKRRSFD